MLVLITYDVNTQDDGGTKRLRQVAKECEKYGQRVQHSVFECHINAAEFEQVRHNLKKIINAQKDSLRFYILGNNYKTKVEHIGVKPSYMHDDILII